jgi:two-component system, cell cycle sensor histidine kinase and response regulator CckA
MQDTVRTVLVIEDEDGVRNLLRTLLRLSGYEVLACQDGPEAVDLMEARGGTLHLVITDVNLGAGMDGFEAAACLRARQPDLKVLYISGRVEADAGERPGIGPADRFLPKPFTPRGFAEAVADMVRPVSANAFSRPA